MTVIDWLATRDWSTGSVGMYGTSYSGFNSIQLAMERAAGVKAIIPIFATDDRFGDDVHYFGGALKALDLVDYPTYMVAMNALPPVPSIFGDGWREEWERRVLETEPWVLTWLAHQRLDDYWKFGSLRFDIGAIECPDDDHRGLGRRLPQQHVPHVRGADLPQTAADRAVVARLHRHVPARTEPRPDPRAPEVVGPLVEGHRQRRRSEPPIMVYAQRSTLPAPDRAEVRGAWRYEPTWPAERLSPTTLALSKAEADHDGDGPDRLDVRGDVGWTAWISCAGAMPWGQSADQRPDEVHSLTYTWDPLEDDLEIMGHARLSVRVSSIAPVAYLSAKLCDVFPDGTSSLVTRGMLNLTHRDSREDPTPSSPEPRTTSSWSSRRCRGCSRPVTASGSISPPPIGPTRGRPPNRGRSRSIGPPRRWNCRCSTGPVPVAEPPLVPPPNRAQANASPKELPKDDPEKGWVVWDVAHHLLRHETRAVAGSMGNYDADRGPTHRRSASCTGARSRSRPTIPGSRR